MSREKNISHFLLWTFERPKEKGGDFSYLSPHSFILSLFPLLLTLIIQLLYDAPTIQKQSK